MVDDLTNPDYTSLRRDQGAIQALQRACCGPHGAPRSGGVLALLLYHSKVAAGAV